MTLLILGAIIIFLTSALGIGLLILTIPNIFALINNSSLLEKLFLVKTSNNQVKNFGYSLVNLNKEIFEDVIIYVFIAILLVLLISLIVITALQIGFKKDRKQTLRLYYTSFTLLILSLFLLGTLIIFTGVWWYTFVLGFIALGSFLVQNSILGLIKNKEQKIVNVSKGNNNNQEAISFLNQDLEKNSSSLLDNEKTILLKEKNLEIKQLENQPIDFVSFQEQFEDNSLSSVPVKELKKIIQPSLNKQTTELIKNDVVEVEEIKEDVIEIEQISEPVSIKETVQFVEPIKEDVVKVEQSIQEENIKVDNQEAMYKKNLEKPVSLKEEILNKREAYFNGNMDSKFNYDKNLNSDVNMINDKKVKEINEEDFIINPDKVYYHSSKTGQTIEINSKEVESLLFDEKQLVQNESISNSFNNENKISESILRDNEVVENQKASGFSLESMTYGALPKSQVKNIDNNYDREHYHYQYPNHMFSNNNCPICLQQKKK